MTDAEGHRIKHALGRALRNFGTVIGLILFAVFEVVSLIGGISVFAAGLSQMNWPMTWTGLGMIAAGIFGAMAAHELAK